jgi:hypothetical protein
MRPEPANSDTLQPSSDLHIPQFELRKGKGGPKLEVRMKCLVQRTLTIESALNVLTGMGKGIRAVLGCPAPLVVGKAELNGFDEREAAAVKKSLSGNPDLLAHLELVVENGFNLGFAQGELIATAKADPRRLRCDPDEACVAFVAIDAALHALQLPSKQCVSYTRLQSRVATGAVLASLVAFFLSAILYAECSHGSEAGTSVEQLFAMLPCMGLTTFIVLRLVTLCCLGHPARWPAVRPFVFITLLLSWPSGQFLASTLNCALPSTPIQFELPDATVSHWVTHDKHGKHDHYSVSTTASPAPLVGTMHLAAISLSEDEYQRFLKQGPADHGTYHGTGRVGFLHSPVVETIERVGN